MPAVNTSRGREILWEEGTRGETKDFESFVFFLNLKHIGIVAVFLYESIIIFLLVIILEIIDGKSWKFIIIGKFVIMIIFILANRSIIESIFY